MEVNGTRLFVHTEGRGEALVVVHGGPVLDHGYLVEPLRPLADTYRLVFFDQRLSGRSAGRVDSASVRYATLHPSQLRSLVLVSPMAPTSELWQRQEEALRESMEPSDTTGMGAVRASDELARGDPAAIERLLQLSFRAQLHDPSLADSLRFHIPPDYGDRSRQFGLMLPDLMEYDFTGGLKALDVPTLVVYGEAEPGAAGGGDTLRALLRGGRVYLIPGAGHFSFFERPAEFLSVVRRFLVRPPRIR